MKRNVIKRTNALFALAVCTALVFASLMGSCKNSSGGDDEIVKSTKKTLIEFSFEKANNSGLSADVKGIINEKKKIVSVEVPHGTDKTKLKASFKISDKAQLSIGSTVQQSGVTENNFSDIINGVAYTVKAEDGSQQNYTVEVYGKNTTEITLPAFGFKKAHNSTLPADVDNQTQGDPARTVFIGSIPGIGRVIIMKLPIGTPEASLATLKPYFTASAGVDLYVGSTKLVSGVTPVDFSDLQNGVKIKAVANDGGSALYNAVVEIDLPNANQTDVQKYFGSYYGTVPRLGEVIIVLEWNKVTLYSKSMSMDYVNVEWEKKADNTYTCTTYKKNKPQIKNLFGKGGYDFVEKGGKITVKTNIMATDTTAVKGDDFVWTAESGYKPVTQNI
ncbi:glycoside hydrolase xylanase domain protein [Treponema socranskii subsp. socranskii VPI DR56BR1116 = ATCC 35536]|uniref:Glycoside hydrolase xylanase domain protein n=1 Tax=Treponema socranskii subsp. socranskii VPI DR56BR1116 = ATCC 35536 TaxID=1125725 RepID=U2LF40_TRESO|nr:glycoside hydrolase [Treponema socranskii]ERF60275.1 glycoside hydrolase xylanase domain protein [Treponema socranskii subsp. socranskii VPI DR56BR1116 = ATCC 35536]ERK03083.1 glycoside hydrolase xylanase domain protein [Treponema socranskii subsp. socranskii VPI DR56BR1116 = ATCC 35536]